MKIENLTPHDIKVLTDKGEKIFKSKGLVRLDVTSKVIDVIDGIQITKSEFGEPIGLPVYQKGTLYIVSTLVKSALPHRKDLVSPSNFVRDDRGNIIGCKSLDM